MISLKKVSFVLIGIFTVIIVTIGGFCLLLMLSKQDDDGPITDYLGNENLYALSKPTIEFTGESEHFSFKTGKLVLGAKTSDGVINCLLVDDFIQNEKIKKLSYLSLTRYFLDDEMVIYENKKPKNILNKKINSFGFFESGIVSYSGGMFEKNFLSEITVDSFKENFRLEITFCTKDNECYGEDFDIYYK